MTVSLFITMLVAFSAICSLFTEAVKRFLENMSKNPSANLIAILNSIVVGGGGTVCAYIILGIPFTAVNIVAIICMVFCVAIGSMVGYDKVIQLIQQLGKTGE